MKTGIVLEGGAFRGLFTAGAIDFLLENEISFDYIVGVSAGAGNALNYVTKQIGRTKWMITADEENSYHGVKHMMKSGKFLDLDRMVVEFSVKQNPFDFEAYLASKQEHELVATNCETGEAEYFGKQPKQIEMLKAMKASCSVPFACKPVEFQGNHYLDGSLSDSIPVQRAFDKGCDKSLVIMTRRGDELPSDYSKMGPLLSNYKKNYPKFYDTLCRRSEMYVKQVELLNELENAGKVMVLRPELESISKFEKDKEKQEAFYQHGRDQMEKRFVELKEFMSW